MEPVTSYRDLIAWQKTMDLCRNVYQETAGLPPAERYGLTAQLRRAAASVPANIAEGWGRGTTADYIRFLRTARGSLYEIQTYIELATGLGYMESGGSAGLVATCDECSRVLNGLIQSLQRNSRQGPGA